MVFLKRQLERKQEWDWCSLENEHSPLLEEVVGDRQSGPQLHIVEMSSFRESKYCLYDRFGKVPMQCRLRMSRNLFNSSLTLTNHGRATI